jgi:L-fucose isomerase-like protein
MMNLFTQYKIPFSAMSPHAAKPDSEEFTNNINVFDRICRICKGMKKLNIGAFGARTTPFKAVRYDEVTLQRYGISVETFDLSGIFSKIKELQVIDDKFINKAEVLKNYCSWRQVPEKSFENMVKLGVVIDDYIEEYKLDALALRCWDEIQQELDISPCVLVSELNERGITAACELDVSSAVAMHVLRLASDSPCACFDWNNNYGTEKDKCIVFHCGPAPKSMMHGEGIITEHGILKKSLPDCGTYGCLTGRLKNSPVTCAGMITLDGKMSFYLLEGEITDDLVPEEFFGCAGVIRIPELQNKLTKIGRHGFRHHVAITHGHVAEAVKEAFNAYLNYSMIKL